MSECDRHPEGAAGSPTAPADAAPRAVAGYRLLRPIGEGGMSAVYQSYDVAADRLVAVKLLADHLAGQPEFVGRFYREARLSRVLEHPNIVQGYTSGFDPEANKHYLVLEFIDGPTAHEVLSRLGRLPVGAVVRIGLDIAHALKFLHDRQYVHRDVKPDNILLHPDGVAKLADLGLAKRLNDDAQLTSVHQGVGTSYYMPYEQAVNANLVDGRSDIFALGATLYHLLTGEVPFAGATHDEVIREKVHNSFRPLRAANPHVPAAVAELIAAMLACDPRARIQSAGEVVDALAGTGLASPLPSYGQAPPAHPGADLPPSNSRTRADHGLSLTRPDAPPLPPVADSFSPGTWGFGGPAAPQPAPKGSAWPWLISAGAVVLALVGQSMRPRDNPTPEYQGPAIVVLDAPTSPGAPRGSRSQ